LLVLLGMDASRFYRAFCRHRDGSWTCVQPATLITHAGRIQVAAGSRVYPGTAFMGFDLVSWLETYIDGHAPLCDEPEER
jgi:hypothetical protein